MESKGFQFIAVIQSERGGVTLSYDEKSTDRAGEKDGKEDKRKI
jgi:hypothetical protein